MNAEYQELDHYLDEVAAHLGPRRGRRDLIMELRSAILDRAEESAGGAPDRDAIRQAMSRMGQPAEVALAYAGERYLIGPRYYRAFLTYTGLVFAIHLVMILIATVTEVGIEIFPISVMRIAHPHSFLNLLFVAAQALLLDIGLMVVIFSLVTRFQRNVRIPKIAFRVPVGLRFSLTRALLAGLVLLLLNVFRDQLFVVVAEGEAHPFFTASFVAVLPWLNAFLALVIAREIAYAFLGERRALVAADALLSAAGAALMVWFLTRPPFGAFPQALNEPSPALPTLNQLTAKLFELILVAFAATFAYEAGKRFLRLIQIWR